MGILSSKDHRQLALDVLCPFKRVRRPGAAERLGMDVGSEEADGREDAGVESALPPPKRTDEHRRTRWKGWRHARGRLGARRDTCRSRRCGRCTREARRAGRWSPSSRRLRSCKSAKDFRVGIEEADGP